jgi:dTDP-glucose pyrophosphorylase
MQAVFACGGKGTRLRPNHVGPKSLTPVGGLPLLKGLISRIAPFHSSPKPPLVIVDQQDEETPRALRHLLPEARIVHQPQPDGVANALLLAQPLLDRMMIVALGDLFLDGTFAPFPVDAGMVFWSGAPVGEAAQNFGIATRRDGFASSVVEKPLRSAGLKCGMGVYVLSRHAIDAFSAAAVDARTGERGITDGIQAAIRSGVRFRTIPFTGYYRNVNSGADLRTVERYMARAVP